MSSSGPGAEERNGRNAVVIEMNGRPFFILQTDLLLLEN